jgi:hypothetical protein
VTRRVRLGSVAAVLATAWLAAAAPAGAALTLTVQAVPQIEGLDFSLGGNQYTTSKTGTVTIPIASAGTYALVALPWRHRDRGIRVAFSRWSDDSFTSARTVKVDRSKTLQAGYGVKYLRGLSFIDCRGSGTTEDCGRSAARVVPASRVRSVTLANSIGEKFVFLSNQPRWLEGARVARRLNGLEETLITYSVMAASVGANSSSNVVNQAQQRFYLTRPKKLPKRWQLAEKTFRIKLSLFDAHFSTHDLLLGTPIGRSLQLTYPDGRKRDVPLVHGEAKLTSLPRGLYKVKVKTGAGIPMEVPVSLSKNQDVQLKVISYADVFGSFLVFALVSVGLVTARRPTLRAAIRQALTGLRQQISRVVRRHLRPEEAHR